MAGAAARRDLLIGLRARYLWAKGGELRYFHYGDGATGKAFSFSATRISFGSMKRIFS